MESGRAAFLMVAQLALEGVFPGTLEVDGLEHPIARTASEYEEDPERGGYEENAQASVRLRTELRAERIPNDELVSLDGREMRVLQSGLEPGDVAWWISLREA